MIQSEVMEPHLHEGVESKTSCQAESGVTRHLTRRPDVRIQVVGEETVVLDERGGHIHQLNRTASFIWRAVDGKTSVEDISRLVIQEFDVREAAAAADVADVIEQLRELGLLCE